jgi:hypothetical protein
MAFAPLVSGGIEQGRSDLARPVPGQPGGGQPYVETLGCVSLSWYSERPSAHGCAVTAL